MQEKDREKVALFRYGLIAPILNGQVANQKEYLAEIAGKVHQVPHYGPKEFTPKTLAGWLLAYRRAGFEGLKPKQRSDRGQSRKLNVNRRNSSWLCVKNCGSCRLLSFMTGWWTRGKSCLRRYPTLQSTGSLRNTV